MTTQVKEPWYITRRGELLSQEFLFELAPKQAIYTGDDPDHEVDYMALFSKPSSGLITIAMTVKPTEEDIQGAYPIQISELQKLKNSNIPVLILVIDVKRNHYFFNWVNEVAQFDETEVINSDQSLLIPLRLGTAEEIQKLKQEILAINP
ncbi:MAG: hypothetical protein VKJ27_06445 [Synechocystis sp.]|nr:hypothetical protein [Synechocystis sp.]